MSWESSIVKNKGKWFNLKRWCLKKIDTLYGKDIYYFLIWAKKIYRKLGGILPRPFTIPNVSKKKQIIFKLDKDWYCLTTHIPVKWPILSTEDIVNVQPMSGPCGLEFKLKFVYDEDKNNN